MTKELYMAELKQLLGELPVDEREEALNYYEDYFADAGKENEESVIADLGSPEKVAFTIKAGLADADKTEGEFTDAGFKGYEDPYKDEIINTIPGSEERGFRQSVPNTRNNLLIAIIILVLLSPIIIPAVASIFGVLLGLTCATIAVMCALAVAGIALLVVGALLFVVSATSIAVHPMGALVLAGASLFIFGVGGIFVAIGVKIISKVIPLLFRAIVSLFKKALNAINRKRGIV